MPTYEFKCRCGRRFEKLCNLGETGEKIHCPQCGVTGPKRVMSSFASIKTAGSDNFSSNSGKCGSCTSTNCGSCGQ